MVAHLWKPFVKILERCSARDVVYKQNPDSLPVVSIRDGAVTFLSRGVPYLRSDDCVLNLDSLHRELHSDRTGGLSLKLVFRVAQ